MGEGGVGVVRWVWVWGGRCGEVDVGEGVRRWVWVWGGGCDVGEREVRVL